MIYRRILKRNIMTAWSQLKSFEQAVFLLKIIIIKKSEVVSKTGVIGTETGLLPH